MAKEKEEEQTEESETKEKKSGSNMLMIIIIIVLVLIIIAGAVVAVLLMNGDETATNKGTPQVKEKTINKPNRNNIQNQAMNDERPLDEIGTLYPLDPFTVNLRSDSDRRYLKTAISLELSGPDLSTELDKKKPVLRDRIIRILSSKTLAEVASRKGKQKLSDQIMNTLNAMITKGQVKGIYFTEFVIQ